MKAIEVGLKNPYLVVVAVLAVIVVGITAMIQIPADLLPQFKTPGVQIVTFYPGMPPEVMERDIMSRMERWTGQSVGIEHQEGKAMLGVCIVKDFFREGISLETAMSQVTSYAMSDMFYLPPGTIPPMVMPFDPTASVPLCLVTVSSPTMTEKELYDVAYYDLRNNLQGIRGVIAPAVYGGVLRRIYAYVDPMELEARNLSPMDIVRTLGQQSIFVPTGNVKIGDIDYQITSNAMPKRVEQLNDMPVKTVDGAVVFMRDIGKVEDTFQIQSNIVHINGRKQVYIPIYRQPGENTLAIVDQIKDQLNTIGQQLRESRPEAQDMVLSVAIDQSVMVRRSVNWLKFSAILGAILAGVVVFVALRSWRSTVVIVLAIPISILIALIGLRFTGNTINSMTLGGLALAIGILVDQSIVVLDNVTRHMGMGKTRMQAALDGTREVSLPVLVSTITFIIVFFPVVFLTGIPRFLFQPLAVAVIFAVVGSYVIAMFVIPSFCAHFVRPPKLAGNPGPPESQSALRSWFERMFPRLIGLRYFVVAAAALCLVLAVLSMGRAGTELFPPVDSNQFTLYVRLPSGTRIENTREVVARIERSIIQELGEPDPDPDDEKHPESNLRLLISNIGVLMDWPAAYTPNTGPMDAFVLVQLKGKAGMPDTFEYVQRLRPKLNEEFPGVEFAFDTGGMMTAALNSGLPSPINIQVQGFDLLTGEEIAQHITRIASAVPGARDVRVAQRMDYPQIDVQIDRVKAAQLGITQEDVIKNIVTATNSSVNFEPSFWIAPNGNHYFIGAQYREQDITSLETLKNIPITGTNSLQPVPLRNIAEFRRATGPAVISHLNITRVIDVYVNVATGYDVGSVAAEIERRLQESTVLGLNETITSRGKVYEVTGPGYGGKGIKVQMKGEVEIMRGSFRQFGVGLVIASILVYLVMVAQLRSFSIPFVIILTVPLAFIGVVAALLLTGTRLNIPTFMGIIMIVGIVVEYSIILLDFANRRVDEGASVRDAIREATWIRLRPILMTSATTWIALLPMAIGAAGGEANAPLARTIIGGVLAATVLSLVVVPCLYVMIRRDESAKSNLALPGVATIPTGE